MKQYRIDELLAEGEQWFESLDEETFERLATAMSQNGDELLVPVVLSNRGRLLDGHHRLMVLQRQGRKTISEADVRIDKKATDPQTEALASIGYQFTRRQLDGSHKAKLARDLMRRFGWSQGSVAKHLGVSRPAVTQWLTTYPDPNFLPPEKVTGLDGKDYTISPDPEPKVKKPRATREHTPAVVVEDYVKQIGNPGWGMWLHQWAGTAPEAERREAAKGLKEIASVCAMLAEGLVPEDNEGGDNEPF